MKFKKIFTTALAIIGLGGTSAVPAQAATATSVTVKQDAINQVPRMVRPVVARRVNGGSVANPYGHHKRGFLDQKRKRKKLRSNAHFSRSKKCTTKK
jgi:hypothetical protein